MEPWTKMDQACSSARLLKFAASACSRFRAAANVSSLALMFDWLVCRSLCWRTIVSGPPWKKAFASRRPSMYSNEPPRLSFTEDPVSRRKRSEPWTHFGRYSSTTSGGRRQATVTKSCCIVESPQKMTLRPCSASANLAPSNFGSAHFFGRHACLAQPRRPSCSQVCLHFGKRFTIGPRRSESHEDISRTSVQLNGLRPRPAPQACGYASRGHRRSPKVTLPTAKPDASSAQTPFAS
mmetsp:Transcript_7715/g.27354  ORF Transcript_7715/g.27354 Transcript_7715/m.27354 type:complete len:237 (-) Transcript_7715:60-770(-)